MKTPEELREIAHRAGHYRDSHGDLPAVSFPRYTCDQAEGTVAISYKDIAEVFEWTASMIEAIKIAYEIGQRGT